MCGIAGIISFQSDEHLPSVVKRMTDLIAHRGPDSEGQYSAPSSQVCLGHRRLSILDLSDAGIQPMTLNQLTITYNGEVYNYIELKKELIQLGHSFKTHTDTEVILAAYAQWGASCVEKFNGMWAFVIYDAVKEQVFCSRDRYGIKPFYYTWIRHRFCFASEIKAFTTVEGWRPKMNKSRAYDFIQSGYLSHTDETLFDGVKELKGGFNILIELASEKISIYPYYDSRKITQSSAANNETETVSKFKELMSDAVRIALRSDVKVGSALSGGLDSSTIVAVANQYLRLSGKEELQECVSACYETRDKNVDESIYIDELAKEVSIKVHKVFPTWEKFMAELDRMVWHQDEPIPTMSIFAQYSVFQEAARNNIKVMLDGQGADEILAGYESFYQPYFLEKLRSSPLGFASSFINYVAKHKNYPFKALLRRLKKPVFSIDYAEGFKNTVTPFRRPTDRSIKEASDNHLQGFGLHSLLRYEDRNSMAFSIESRVPFLDYRVVKMSLELPDELKIRKGVRKFVLREAFKKDLPKMISQRYDKLGFPTPQERWTSENAEQVNELFRKAVIGLPEIFEAKMLEHSLKKLKAGEKEFVFFVWRVINLKKWIDCFKVSI